MLTLPWRPTHGQLRVFSAVLLLLGVGLALRSWGLRATALREVAAGGAVVAGLLGLAAPRAIRGLYCLWLAAVLPLSLVVSHLLLLVLWLGVISPIGLLGRLLGRDPLAVGAAARRRSSQWYRRPPPSPPDSYRRQS